MTYLCLTIFQIKDDIEMWTNLLSSTFAFGAFFVEEVEGEPVAAKFHNTVKQD